MTTRFTRRSLLAAATALMAGAPAGATTMERGTRIEGRWLYRNFANRRDGRDEPGPLLLESGIMEIVLYSETGFTGILAASGYRLNLSGTLAGEHVRMRGTQASENTAGWHYEYAGWLAPRWTTALDQAPTIVGTVLRATDHLSRNGGVARAGATTSFIAVLQA